LLSSYIFVLYQQVEVLPLYYYKNIKEQNSPADMRGHELKIFAPHNRSKTDYEK